MSIPLQQRLNFSFDYLVRHLFILKLLSGLLPERAMLQLDFSEGKLRVIISR